MAFNPTIPGYSQQGKSFARNAAFPLDGYEIWTDYTELEAYAANTDPKKNPSYIGQKVVYYDTENKTVTHYSIEPNGSLKELGSNSSISVFNTLTEAQNYASQASSVGQIVAVRKDQAFDYYSVTGDNGLTTFGGNINLTINGIKNIFNTKQFTCTILSEGNQQEIRIAKNFVLFDEDIGTNYPKSINNSSSLGNIIFGFGCENTSGTSSLLLGRYNKIISGNNNLIGGQGNIILSGSNNFVFGYKNAVGKAVFNGDIPSKDDIEVKSGSGHNFLCGFSNKVKNYYYYKKDNIWAGCGYNTSLGNANSLYGQYLIAAGTSHQIIGNSNTAFNYNNKIMKIENFSDTVSEEEKNGVKYIDITEQPTAASAFGYNTFAYRSYQAVFGYKNKKSKTDAAFLVGWIDANKFAVYTTGQIYAPGGLTTNNADYAEYFEWDDGNPYNEDRVGYFVTLTENGKIKKANTSDHVLGIISINPSVVGNSYGEEWQRKYLTDEWGRIQYQEINTEEIKDELGNTIISSHKEVAPTLNPDYDPNQKYIPREQRKEWSPVGLLGILRIRVTDANCQYVKCGKDGVGEPSTDKSDYKVLKKINDNIVEIFIK